MFVQDTAGREKKLEIETFSKGLCNIKEKNLLNHKCRKGNNKLILSS